MIRSLKDRNTKRFFEGHRVAAFHGFADQAVRRLTLLESAESLGDLAALQSNRLESLRGDRKAPHSRPGASLTLCAGYASGPRPLRPRMERTPPVAYAPFGACSTRGQWSIRINEQWRICFRWEEDGPCDVEVVDYHD